MLWELIRSVSPRHFFEYPQQTFSWGNKSMDTFLAEKNNKKKTTLSGDMADMEVDYDPSVLQM